MKRLILIGVLGAALALTSCATYESKIGNDVRDRFGLRSQWGYFYTGVVDAAAGVCFVKASWITEPKAIILVPIWIVTVLVAVPLALVTDTLVLPIDAFTTATVPRTTFSEYCDYHAGNWRKDD